MADDPMKEGRARRREVKERSFLLCLVVFSIVSCVFYCVLLCLSLYITIRAREEVHEKEIK